MFKKKTFWIYILTNYTHTTLYIGVTSNLKKRISQHKSGTGTGFTQRYKLYKLIYLELHNFAKDAILREKQLKKWSRAKKNELISTNNPDWEEIDVF